MKNMENIEKTIRRRSIIAFTVFGTGIVFAVFAWNWLNRQPKIDGAKAPIRKTLEFNEGLFKRLVGQAHLVKTFPLSAVDKKVRVNGSDGLSTPLDSNWRLHLVRKPGDTLILSLNDIKALPKTEIVFDFKCVEGWSQITHWGGVKVKDLLERLSLGDATQKGYAGLSTPDGKYYVGIDMASFIHPQTILCYEMNGKPLPVDQGYPLRLIIPVKYGIKHIKRIGTLYFSDQRPPDFWAEKGYDYFAGL